MGEADPPLPFHWDFVTPGLPDSAFEDAPGFSPTPMELRVMLLAHLRPRADSLVWDVGGGTGALAWKALPLTLAVAGMLRHRLYTYRWMSLLIWLYFTEGVVRAASDRGASQWLAGIEVALSTALFVGCLVYVRQRLKVLPPKAKKGQAPKGSA